MAKRDSTLGDQIHGRDILLVSETPVGCPQIAGFSRIESELMHLFRSCHHAGRSQLIRFARLFAELNTGAGNVIDFERYRETHHG
jgi:hypothetical protein